MIAFHQSGNVKVHHGDCLDVLRQLPDASVDSVVTDPPYALGFMGRKWDTHTPGGFQHWCEMWGAECLRILKPGGHLLAFGGTRTYHRLAAGLEDSGLEIRDSIHWIYAEGYPHALDVGKAIDKLNGSSGDREVVGRKLDRVLPNTTYAANVGSGRHAVGERIVEYTAPASPDAKKWNGWATGLKPAHEPIVAARKPFSGSVAQNVLDHGTGALNVNGCRSPMSEEDRENFERGSEAWVKMSLERGLGRKASEIYGEYGIQAPSEAHAGGRWPPNVILDSEAAHAVDAHSDRGSRYFPIFIYEPKADGKERPLAGGNLHPTVKPLDLMRHLVRLVTPPGGTVLEPFAGSGTTVEAAICEGFGCVAIEREADYLPLILQRINRRRDPVAYVQGLDDPEPSLFDVL